MSARIATANGGSTIRSIASTTAMTTEGRTRSASGTSFHAGRGSRTAGDRSPLVVLEVPQGGRRAERPRRGRQRPEGEHEHAAAGDDLPAHMARGGQGPRRPG